jgi:hypothetical protein
MEPKRTLTIPQSLALEVKWARDMGKHVARSYFRRAA